MTSLAFDQVRVDYAKRTAVASFTDTVKPGEWLCIIGPNGAGKSSLLRSIAGVVPHSGRILVDGSPLTARSSRRRAQLIAYVPQLPVLPSGMTGAEYVLLGRNPFVTHFGRESELDHSMVDDVIDRLDLAKLATRDVDTLSGGERQRLVIARAMPGDEQRTLGQARNLRPRTHRLLGPSQDHLRHASVGTHGAAVMNLATILLLDLREERLTALGQTEFARNHLFGEVALADE